MFNPENNIRLADQHVLNHFPNHFELTRKDLMVKNLKRYKKELERVNAERAAESGCAAADLDLECIPTTFILPNDFSLFAEEFRKQEQAGRQMQMWIMKPTSGSRGIGIFIISRLSQLLAAASLLLFPGAQVGLVAVAAGSGAQAELCRLALHRRAACGECPTWQCHSSLPWPTAPKASPLYVAGF
eukprot:scaffold58349_cov36-Phaeocystis_antarctica.AAC.1